jgi:hypothetical protein
MSLNTRLEVLLQATQTAPQDLGSASFPATIRRSLNLVDGAAAGKANRFFSDTRTIAASGSESLDLAGTLADAFGVTITLARVKLLYVAAADANVNNVVIGGVASNGWITPFGDATDKLVLRPGAFVLLAAGRADATGYAVTASTGDLLQVANSGSGTPVTYTIAIIGAAS